VLGQVLVFVLFLLLAKPGTAGLLLLFGLLHRDTRHAPAKKHVGRQTGFGESRRGGRRGFHSPLLQLGRGHEARRAVLGVLQLALPPVVVVLGDDLDDVTHLEADAGLLAWDEVVFRRVVLELSADVDLEGGRDTTTRRQVGEGRSWRSQGERMGENMIGQAAHTRRSKAASVVGVTNAAPTLVIRGLFHKRQEEERSRAGQPKQERAQTFR